MKKILFHLLPQIPQTLVYGWGFPILMRVLHLAGDLHWRKDFTLAAVWRPSVRRRWKWSTTLGLGQVFHLDHLSDEELLAHERRHKRQFRADALRGLLMGGLLVALGAPLWTGALVWFLMPAFLLTNFIESWANGGHFYRDSIHEEDARDTAKRELGL